MPVGVFTTADIIEQHNLLNQVADLVDAGKIRTTVSREFRHDQRRKSSPRAQADRKQHATIGKIVLEGF